MRIKVLSIENPASYLVVFGIKDIENRNWEAFYRGRLYIHSSGKSIDYTLRQKDIPKEIEIEVENKIEKAIRKNILKGNEKITKRNIHRIGLSLLAIQIMDLQFKAMAYHRKIGNSFFKSQAIIGYVDLVDIIRNSKSIFAELNSFHWIFKNPVLLKNPIENVNGRLGIWDFKI